MEGEETRGGGKGENKGLEDFSFALHDSNKCVGLVLELPQVCACDFNIQTRLKQQIRLD